MRHEIQYRNITLSRVNPDGSRSKESSKRRRFYEGLDQSVLIKLSKGTKFNRHPNRGKINPKSVKKKCLHTLGKDISLLHAELFLGE